MSKKIKKKKILGRRCIALVIKTNRLAIGCLRKQISTFLLINKSISIQIFRKKNFLEKKTNDLKSRQSPSKKSLREFFSSSMQISARHFSWKGNTGTFQILFLEFIASSFWNTSQSLSPQEFFVYEGQSLSPNKTDKIKKQLPGGVF